MKTRRYKVAEIQTEELAFAPLRPGGSALNCSAPSAAVRGRMTLAQGTTLGSVSKDEPGHERAKEIELPEGWRFVPFNETICPEMARVVKVQQSKYRKSGLFPIIDQGEAFIAGYWDSEDDVYREHLPVIVFGDHTRVLKFVDFPFVAGADGTHVLVPDTNRFDPFFLYLALSSLEIPSRGYNRHFRLLKERSIVTPPNPEQRAIAVVLRTVQEAKEACEQVLVATNQLKQSLLHHLFTYGPVPLSQASHVPLRDTEFGALPNHWSISKLGGLSYDISDGNYSTKYPRAEEFTGAGIPFIRANNIKGTHIVWDDMRFISPEKHKELAKGHLKRNDILITTRGDLGNVALVGDEFVGANINAQIVRMNTADVSDPRFVLFTFQTPFVQKQIEGLKTGTALPQLPVGKLKMIQLPLAPLPEQREISAQLSAVDAKLAAAESRRSALAALFQSLLHYLMTGKVRLPEFTK